MPERLHPTIAMMPDPSGNYTRYQHHAAGPVRTDTPERERVPLLCQYGHGTHVITFYDGRFRHPVNGGTWAAPRQWAYITWDDEPMEDPEPGPVPTLTSPGLWQDIVNLLLKHLKWSEILNLRDRSPYNNPEEGAPENGN